MCQLPLLLAGCFLNRRVNKVVEIIELFFPFLYPYTQFTQFFGFGLKLCVFEN